MQVMLWVVAKALEMQVVEQAVVKGVEVARDKEAMEAAVGVALEVVAIRED
jgi:hypothetical protein